jgi:undecaprenyl pyrophosphate phosphatase UppP
MDLVVAFTSVVMGVVEGLTGFLPGSATGHRISSHTVTAFGSRIAPGLIIAALLVLGVVAWTD